ncbi:MAG: biopolymer transporter ExbD [Proteobacteria bacterium]|nr:biopolymer transporter ExbD [Pseudomonadota bacterium]MBU4011725.1 biopolymer transporter ExbD [Pseudomonadota bacterium]
MRAYRKRPWPAMAVNLTPLIDVVFLIIIFFITIINFSEMQNRKVTLPKADEAVNSKVDERLKISLTIKSEDTIFLDGMNIKLDQLDRIYQIKNNIPKNVTIVIQADEKVPYAIIKNAMHKLSLANISKIEFSTLKDKPDPLQED